MIRRYASLHLLPRFPFYDADKRSKINIKIRPATTRGTRDTSEIYRLHVDAFGEIEGPVVAQLAVDLLADQTAEPVFPFLAEDEGRAVGCIIFSAVKLLGPGDLRGSILAPLAVASAFQRNGIGNALVKHGMGVLKSQGIDLVFVYGDPKYYSRFGFTPDHHVVAPYQLKYPEAWMANELTQGFIAIARGEAVCSLTLSRPEYW